MKKLIENRNLFLFFIIKSLLNSRLDIRIKKFKKNTIFDDIKRNILYKKI